MGIERSFQIRSIERDGVIWTATREQRKWAPVGRWGTRNGEGGGSEHKREGQTGVLCESPLQIVPEISVALARHPNEHGGLFVGILGAVGDGGLGD